MQHPPNPKVAIPRHSSQVIHDAPLRIAPAPMKRYDNVEPVADGRPSLPAFATKRGRPRISEVTVEISKKPAAEQRQGENRGDRREKDTSGDPEGGRPGLRSSSGKTKV